MLHKFKTTLKIINSPKKYQYKKFSKTLAKLNPVLLQLKSSYSNSFKIVKLKESRELPRVLSKLPLYIEKLFDVKAFEVKRILSSSFKPIRVPVFVGDERQVNMAAHFFVYVRDLYKSTMILWKQKYRLDNRQNRQRLRRQEIFKYDTVDARRRASEFSIDLIEFFYTSMDNLLDELEINNKIYLKGQTRKKAIHKRMYQKYGRAWKSQILSS